MQWRSMREIINIMIREKAQNASCCLQSGTYQFFRDSVLATAIATTGHRGQGRANCPHHKLRKVRPARRCTPWG